MSKMVQKSALLSFDAFSKTEEDVRIRTRSGGLISLSCVVLTIFLLISEWLNFNQVVTRPGLIRTVRRSQLVRLTPAIPLPIMSPMMRTTVVRVTGPRTKTRMMNCLRRNVFAAKRVTTSERHT